MTRPAVSVATALLLATLAGTLAGCGSSSGSSSTPVTGQTETATTSGGVQRLTVTAGNDRKFQQTHLIAGTGKVQLTLVVTGDVPHNLIVTNGPEANTGTGTVSNGKASITLTFAKPGVYNYICTIHPYMKGTITVS